MHMHDRWRTTELQQLVASTMVVLTLVVLAALGVWPFDTATRATDGNSSVLEVALGDRVTIGLIRTAVVAIVGYVVVSVPALVLERRWIQGLTTSGLTAGADRIDPHGISRQLAELLEWLATRDDQIVELAKAVRSFDTRGTTSEGDDDDR